MQKVKLNTIIYSEGKYSIYLDPETRYYFSNKRKAQDYLRLLSVQTDKAILFITEALDRLTEFYNLYNLADSDYEFKFKVKSCIDYLNNRIAWISERHGSENSQALIIQAIHGCYSELIQAFTLIHDKAATRNDTILKKRCALRIEIIEMYADNLFNIKTESINEVKLKTA
jgi:hypothetical protein